MLDHLREEASSTLFPEEEEFPVEEGVQVTRRPSGPLLGMTAQQRFILSLMLLMAVCTLGVMFLMVMGKIVPSFLF